MLFAAAILLAVPTTACAQTQWTAGTGDWNTPGNWTLGVPNSGSPTAFDAIIANGGTAQLQAPGGTVRRLRVGALGGNGSLLVDGGTLLVTDDLHVNEGGFSASMTVQNGSTVTAPDTVIGFSGGFNSSFLLTGAGTTYNSTTSFIAGQSASGTGAIITVNDGAVLSSGTTSLGTGGLFGATVDGSGTRWWTTGAFAVGTGGNGTLLIANQGTVHVGTTLSINSTSDVQLNGGTLRFNTISGLNRLSYSAGTIQLAGNRTLDTDATIAFLYGPFLSPPASISIPTGKALTVEGDANQFQNNRTVTVSGGSLTSTNHTIGLLTNGGGFLVVNGGGTVATILNATLGDVPNSFGTATVSGAGSSWNIGGNLIVGASANNGMGTLSIQDQSLVYVGTALSINNFSTVNLQGGTLRFNTVSGLNRLTFASGTIQLAGDRGVGADATITTLYGAFPTVSTGKGLTVEGTATLTKPLTIAGGTFRTTNLAVGAGGSLSFDHGILELAGGSVSGLSNLIIPANGELRATSPQTTRITAAAGSTITATGDLTLGSAALPTGFYGNGDLAVGANAVTLLDANDAVFDSAALVTLGAGGSPGTLAAANGLTLDFGANLIGFGSIDSLNSATAPLTNNGHVTGNSVDEPLTLSGYVKGVGTFDNVSFTGTFSPGLSPTSLHVGNLALSNSSTLVMELGGTTAGSGYDQLISSGTLTFDGALQVVLTNSFTPAAGQSFNLFDWGNAGGVFDSLALPALAGLAWNTSQLYTDGIISLSAAGLPGDYNQNGIVDAADYTVWRDNLDNGTALANDDTPGVGMDDYNRWKTNFGMTAGAGSSQLEIVSVPEPTCVTLLGTLFTCTAGMFARKRRP